MDATSPSTPVPSPCSHIYEMTSQCLYWHHSMSQSFQISADLRIQLCWYYLYRCQLGTDAISRMSHFRALLKSLILPRRELVFLHWWWRMRERQPWEKRSGTPLSDIKQGLAAWTLKSNKTEFESRLPLTSWVASRSICFLSEFSWRLNKAMYIHKAFRALTWHIVNAQ